MKTQVIRIHGGDSHNTYEDYLKFLREWQIDFESYRNGKGGWKKYLAKALGDDYEVIQPDMPSKINAKYLEWKIWFEKFIPHFNDEVILIGNSQGGTFLAKYLAENSFPKKIKALFLVAAPFDEKDNDYSLADFTLPSDLRGLARQPEKIFLYYSEDDPMVAFVDLAKYQKSLSEAITRIFKDRGHFIQEQFPEIVEDIRSLS